MYYQQRDPLTFAVAVDHDRVHSVALTIDSGEMAVQAQS